MRQGRLAPPFARHAAQARLIVKFDDCADHGGILSKAQGYRCLGGHHDETTVVEFGARPHPAKVAAQPHLHSLAAPSSAGTAVVLYGHWETIYMQCPPLYRSQHDFNTP